MFEDIVKEFWCLIDKEKDVDNIFAKLLSMYNVDYNTLKKDMFDIINQLVKEDLLIVES